MAKTEIAVPSVTRISFRQDKEDPDYGTCMWADFDFDTEKYTLQIMSDCGNYSYGWCPTPKTESFFHLCKRFDPGYLIQKLADKTQINDEKTLHAAVELFKYDELPGGWEKELEEGLYSCCNEQEIVDAIYSFANDHNITIDDGLDVWYCIEKDYTANAKKIVDVYMTHIVPVISTLEQEENGEVGR